MTIDLPTLQSWIAALTQLENAIGPMIPGALGTTVRQWITFSQALEANPVAQQLVVWLINNLSNLQSPADVKKLFEGFTVSNTVA